MLFQLLEDGRYGAEKVYARKFDLELYRQGQNPSFTSVQREPGPPSLR